MNDLMPKNYKEAFLSIKSAIELSRIKAVKAANSIQLDLYWKIGLIIFNKKEEGKWGSSVVENLSQDLRLEYPEIKGLSSSNLWRMLKFFNSYKENDKLAPLVREIGWSHNVAIFEKCKDDLEKEFYLRMTAKFGWTRDLLINQIESGSYEKYLLNQTNFDQNVPEEYKEQAMLAVKDEYSFDFVELTDKHSEKNLEYELVRNIRRFLLEMGSDFTFIGNQYKVSTETKDYYIDLLLYHRKLKCLIAIDLKIGDFIPEYAGKMQFYLTLLDEKIKNRDENPSIGIIVCKTKDRTEVEYALKKSGTPIGVATYKITKTLPESMKNLLPSPEKIAQKLSGLSAQP
ncbi:DUF1016 family protein [bacterium]|nr:DUF1016 family protein [bacterium]MDX9806358.1 PDDEXK nuclease domain-containing protein [bacterium]